MRKETQIKLFHFYGGCFTSGHFFIQNGNPEKIFSFGFGKYGELANGKSYKTKKISIYRYAHATPKILKNFPTGKVSKIAKGSFHTLFLMIPEENVYGVGRSEYGTLSIKQTEVLSPILVTSEALKGVKIGDIACGDNFSVLLSKNGVPYACGDNEDGQCGDGTYEECVFSAIPMKIKEKVIQIDCGYGFTVLLTNKRDIYKTGSVYDEEEIPNPTKLELNEKVKLFRAGSQHLLVVGESGQLYGMGDNTLNQLTSKSLDAVDVLTKITSLPSGKIKDIKCSEYDSYALMENNDLYGWGRNFFGQSKGNGTVTRSFPFNPIPFKMKSNVEQIEVGKNSCFVFCTEGVYVCGRNVFGDLGMGNSENIYAKLTLNKYLSNIKRIVSKEIIPKFDPRKLIFDVVITTKC